MPGVDTFFDVEVTCVALSTYVVVLVHCSMFVAGHAFEGGSEAFFGDLFGAICVYEDSEGFRI